MWHIGLGDVRWLLGAVLALVLAASAHAEIIYWTTFDDGIPAEITGPGVQVESVQGYAGLGADGNRFDGDLLRYHTQTLYDTVLTLTDLAPHTHISLGFLLAVIDSWDGTELFEVLVDGQTVFSHWFQLATGDDSSYVAPPGGLLSSGTNLGWTAGSYHGRDRALDLSLEPAFHSIPHTASTLTIVWRIGAVSGGAAQNWQGGMDESWGIDNLVVSAGSQTSSASLPPVAAALLGNAPNPFNPSTHISYVLPAGGATITLTVHDLAGRLVRTLVSGTRTEGRQVAAWDGCFADGRPAPGGVYLYRLAGDGLDETRKMMLLK